MSSSRRPVLPVLSVLLAIVPVAAAQQGKQNNPHIGYVCPAGGKQGTAFEVSVGGQFLQGASEAYVFGAGVEVAVVGYSRPLTPKEFNAFRDKLKELLEKKAASGRGVGQGRSRSSTRPVWTADDEKALAELRMKLANPPNRQGNPAIAETVTLRVTMAQGAEPGERELRLRTPAGLTNPLVFCVSALPEFTEDEPKREKEPPGGKAPTFIERPRGAGEGAGGGAEPEMTVTLPAVVNGQIMPGDVDRFRFKARTGQRLVVAVSARALIPYLPDAVPGWFQATLALYDANGEELAYDDDYRFHPDPVIFFRVPRSGEYVLEIRDAVYRGREDFVYRIALGELPFVTSAFPLGGPVSARTPVALKGWNLPATGMTPAAEEPGIQWLSVRRGQWVSNSVPFAVDTLPESVEKESNGGADNAQPVTLPLVVNGHIDEPGDWDAFRFEGRAGDEIVAEVCARRLDSPLDSVVKLTDADGRQLAFNDDHEDKGAGLTTHHADSWLRARLPADGSYDVHIGDRQDKGGAEYAYRLRISGPRPDFELRVVPSSISGRVGASVALTLYALRKDGFSGDIEVALKDAPAGFKLGGARVPGNQDQVRLTLTMPPMPTEEPVSLSLEGRATIDGREVIRPAVPAEDMMQAFAYRHLVPAKELLVIVSGRFMRRETVRILSATPVRIPAGGTARVQVGAPPFMGRIQLELSEPPDGIAIQSVSPRREGTEIVLKSDATKVKPGLKGNLIVNAFAERLAPPGKGNAQKNGRRIPLGALPAVPFEIVAK